MSAPLPTNQVELSLGDVARATGGVLTGDPTRLIRGISTDSRANLSGMLFLALVGERFDAHDFVEQAREQGAAALLVEREVETTLPTVRVKSTLAALGALGAEWRKTWGGKVVAVAGSAGKTTTRAALSALLEATVPGSVHYARGNFDDLMGAARAVRASRERNRRRVELGTTAPARSRR